MAKVAQAKSRGSFPRHLTKQTPQGWRALKRTQWKAVERALDTYMLGSAYVPAYREAGEVRRLAEQIRKALRGRWVAW